VTYIADVVCSNYADAKCNAIRSFLLDALRKMLLNEHGLFFMEPSTKRLKLNRLFCR